MLSNSFSGWYIKFGVLLAAESAVVVVALFHFIPSGGSVNAAMVAINKYTSYFSTIA